VVRVVVNKKYGGHEPRKPVNLAQKYMSEPQQSDDLKEQSQFQKKYLNRK